MGPDKKNCGTKKEEGCEDLKGKSTSSLLRSSRKADSKAAMGTDSRIPRKEQSPIKSRMCPPEDKKFSLKSSSKPASNEPPKSAKRITTPRNGSNAPSAVNSAAAIKSSTTIMGIKGKNARKPGQDLISNHKMRSFTSKKNKLREAQADFLKFCEANKDITTDKYELVSMVKDGDAKLVISEGVNLPIMKKLKAKIENTTLNEFKEKLKIASDEQLKICQNLLQKLDSLQVESDIEGGDNSKMRQDMNAMRANFACEFKEKHAQFAELMNYVDTVALPWMNREVEGKLKVESLAAEKTIADLNGQIETYRKKIDVFEKKLSDWKAKEATRIDEGQSIVNEIISTKQEYTEVLNKNRYLEDVLEKQKDCIAALELNNQTLHDDLDVLKRSAAQGAGDHSNLEEDLLNEMNELKAKLAYSINDKAAVEVDRDALQVQLTISESTKKELCDAREEIANLIAENESLTNHLNHLQSNLQNKIKIINELEVKNTNCSDKDMQAELEVLRQMDKDKDAQIQDLNMQLNKANMEIKQCNETIVMHKRVLKIRSELINSMQDKEKTENYRMTDLHSELTKNSSLINKDNAQLNFELSAKAEELQNLFSTVGSKQMEISRQEHIIKMQEEELERSKKLRMRQAEKIDCLKKELGKTKEALTTYEQNLLRINEFNRQQLFEENISEEHLNHYESGRRMKRQTDVVVKKIDK